MEHKILEIRAAYKSEINQAASLKQLDEVRIKFLSRNGSVSALFEEMKTLTKEQKPLAGKELNALRNFCESLFIAKKEEIEAQSSIVAPKIDLSLPGVNYPVGSRHILTRTLDEIKSIFKSYGFSVSGGPELESDFNNFEALNFQADHPARDMQDTFFVTKDFLLRTHTSPVQIRLMQNNKPPIRAIMPGKVYRNEAVSSRSYCLFHQVEGLYVDKHVTFAELKGTLVAFAKEFYGSNLKYRFRPSYFPFTEPSAEMDITCFICGGKGCRVCKNSGWLEVLGCGMVDPQCICKNWLRP